MMGVHPAVHFLAWILENVAVLTVSSAALALILKVSGVFSYSSAWIVFLFLLDFGVSVVTLSYLLSALFSRPVWPPSAAACSTQPAFCPTSCCWCCTTSWASSCRRSW